MRIRIFLVLLFACWCTEMIYAQGITNCNACDKRLLKAADIDTLSIDELRLLTNEIYARQGYVFTNERYQSYFTSFEWYKPLGNNSQVKLSATAEKNIKLLTDRRKTKEDERKTIFTYFKALKGYAASDNYDGLIKAISNPDLESADCRPLKEALLHIDFDNVNWYKNNALYRIEIDNGYVKKVYSFSITREKIVLTYNRMAHSDIMEAFDTMFSDYMSETEFASWWTFSLHNGQVMLDRIEGAG